jgi:hypothetical protein
LNVEAAWNSFVEFVQVPIDGRDDQPDIDSDGVLVQWGRWSWHDWKPALVLMRQFAVGTDGDSELWQVGLELVFDESAATAGQADVNPAFDFAPIGPDRAAALRRAATFAPLEAVMSLRSVTSRITFEQVC